MLIRWFWRDFDHHGKKCSVKPIDAFWVEATQEEAKSDIFPKLQPSAISKSRELAERFKKVAERRGNHARPFCFLVARDLSSIAPFPVHYPVHQMWNAYSPFESMPEMVVASLDDLWNLDLPSICSPLFTTRSVQ